jgi:hypothetical protein
MAIGFYFAPSSFPVDAYDKSLKKLEEAGVGAPAGRLYHFALETDGNVQVFDVWESQAAFDAFGATLVPILADHGVDPGAPMTASIHNTIVGA